MTVKWKRINVISANPEFQPQKEDTKPADSANQPQKEDTKPAKSKIPVAEIVFGSTKFARFITLVTLGVFIVSILDLAWTLSNYTPDLWDPKISGVITMITSAAVSALLMITLNRKMNATVTPLNDQT